MMRGAILAIGFLSTILAITVQSVGGLFLLCADLVFVILFPQLLCGVFIDFTNTYGAVAGYIIGLILRVIGGEKLLHFPPLYKFPGFEEETQTQLFPFRTLAMVVSLISILIVSVLFNFLFKSGKLPKKADIFKCIVNLPPPEKIIPTNGTELTDCNLAENKVQSLNLLQTASA